MTDKQYYILFIIFYYIRKMHVEDENSFKVVQYTEYDRKLDTVNAFPIILPFKEG